MRFWKGSIEISFAQDIPLLRQVLHSQFITHDKLFEFMDIGNYERKRPTFNWRVRRLVEHDFPNRYYFPEIDRSCPYRIGPRTAGVAETAATPQRACPGSTLRVLAAIGVASVLVLALGERPDGSDVDYLVRGRRLS